MNPDEKVVEWWQGCRWDTPEYWERREAREKLKATRARIKSTERPKRTRRFKLAEKSRRRNRA